ncbi:MAG TPA: hypothetical protein VFV11_08100 [Solimonas sp.]|nr:hypothetical protein [Solimonas sp.]
MKLSMALRASLGFLLLAASATVQAAPCLIFVHGKQTDTNTYTSWTAARNYWKKDSGDFIREATKQFATSYYVVGYNGTNPYYGAQAAGEVANEIVNATNGGADGGGNRCAQTYANGGTFWVVAHSMGGAVMDYILGNNDASDPNYNYGGAPFSTVATRLAMVVTTGGAHRGSEGADAVCGDSSGGCNWAASWIQSCDTATYWLRSADDVQVRTYSNAPARNIYLTGGYEAIFGASACLSGEDDGVVQYASIFACNGSANASYNNSNACNNSYKQETSGFRNLDASHENHDDERNDVDRDTRKAIPDGIWMCGSVKCSPDTTVQSAMSTGKFISILY